jgi:hypothetical protein
MPNLDGKGMDMPKSKTWEESVQGNPHTNVPGGESKGGKQIKMEGPNSATNKKTQKG